MHNSIQILGFGPHYLAVLHDIIRENKISAKIEVFKNLSSSSNPVVFTQALDLNIHEKGSIVDKNLPCVFGVSGGNNKEAVFEYFQKKYNIAQEGYLSIIDKSSITSLSVEVGLGCILEQNVCVAAQTKLNFGVSVKRGVNIGHHCVIENFVDINPGTTIAGKVEIGSRTTIGAGAVILDGVHIGENSIIGAGSIVTKNIPSNVIAYGNPCKVIREIKN